MCGWWAGIAAGYVKKWLPLCPDAVRRDGLSLAAVVVVVVCRDRWWWGWGETVVVVVLVVVAVLGVTVWFG